MALRIGDVAERSGVSAPTIRYYETIGLLAPPPRSAAGYRHYSPAAIEELRFIRKAQGLGFSLDEIAGILELSRGGEAPCAHVLELARRQVAVVDERIRQLKGFRDRLAGELAKWNGIEQPTCEGLCQIIVRSDATTPAPLHFGTTGGRSGTRR